MNIRRRSFLAKRECHTRLAPLGRCGFFLDPPGNAARREVRRGENAFHKPAPFIAAVTDFYFELLAFRRQIQRLITN
jgi:hypothetical protein